MAEELEYKSVFDGEQIDRAIGVIINGDIDGDVERAESAATAAEQAANIATAAAQDAEAVAVRTPYVGDNGNWFAWDIATDSYQDSGVPAQGESGVYMGDTEPTDEDVKVWIDPNGEPSDLEFPATNLVVNGDFSAGTVGWSMVNAGFTISATNKELIMTLTASPPSAGVYRSIGTIVGHKYYARAMFFPKYSRTITIGVGSVAVSNTSPAPNVWTSLSSVISATTTGNFMAYQVTSADYVNGDQVKLKYAFCVDLTATFGPGNEPTVAEMDAIMAYWSNSWFDGTANLAQPPKMLPYLLAAIRAKAAIAQEAWITPTLINGWIDFNATNFSSCQYFKDAIGIVHLKGMIKGGTIGQAAFALPTGYRIAKLQYFTTCSNSAYGQIIVSNTGTVTPSIGNNAWISLNGITFRAEA